VFDFADRYTDGVWLSCTKTNKTVQVVPPIPVEYDYLWQALPQLRVVAHDTMNDTFYTSNELFIYDKDG